MALVNLTTIYTTQNWSLNNAEDTTVHTDYTPENVSAQKKFNLLPSTNQSAFFRRNEKNIGLDQVQSVSERGNRLGLGNLKTGLKSLSFGSDKPGGGSSDQPFVTFDMNGTAQFKKGSVQNVDQGELRSISTSNKSFIDFPKRGGNYPSNDIDFKRIQAFLNTPAGTTFLDKQKKLQFMNPRIETGTSMKVSNNTSTLPGLIENTRVYSSENLLNQIKVQGTGGHVSRVGASNLAIQDDFYANTVGLQNITNSSALNRLAILHRLKIAKSNANMFSSLDQLLGAAESTLVAKSLGISTNQTLLFNYPGGPNSGDGLGNTTVGRYVDTTLNTLPTVMGYAQIAQQNAIKDGPTNIEVIQDFRTKVEDPYIKNAKNNWTYKDSMRYRIGTIDIGSIPSTIKSDYTITTSSDKINMMMPTIYRAINDEDPWKKFKDGKDSIKLGFECMSNDYVQNSTALIFRALLTNGFSDNNSANLNSFRYMGRGEEFFTYQGFTRQISFSFKIAAFSRSELKPLYNKLNYLISQVYPDYSPNTNVMRAPLVKITLGDYLYRVPGFIESINVTADNSSPWEINLENSADVQELPHVLEIAISFKPIHNILPKRQTNDSVNLITNGFIDNPINSLDGSQISSINGLPLIQNSIRETPIDRAQVTNIPNFGTIEA